MIEFFLYFGGVEDGIVVWGIKDLLISSVGYFFVMIVYIVDCGVFGGIEYMLIIFED